MKKIVLILTIFISMIGYANGGDNENEFSFFKETYINPRIIEDMSTWISDTGDQIMVINLTDTQNSNRYYGDYNIRKGSNEFPIVEFEREEGNGGFGYEYIGKLNSGLEVIETFDNGGGSLTSTEVVFFQIIKDKGMTFDTENQKIIETDERTLIYRVGSVGSYGYKNIEIINGKLKMEK